jgi:hypothetical protein
MRCARRSAVGATPLFSCLDPASLIHPCVHTQPEDALAARNGNPDDGRARCHP